MVEKKTQGWMVAVVAVCILSFGVSGCSAAAKKQRMNSARAHYNLGLSHLNENRYQPAYIEFQKAVEFNPKDKDSYYAMGHIFYVQEKDEEAVKAFKKALKIDPRFSDAHNYIGMVYERQKNYELAVRQFRKALMNPRYATPEKAHYNLGRNFLQLGKIDEAIEEFQSAVMVAPDYAPGFNALGKALLQNDRNKEAAAAFNNAVKIVPSYTEAHYFLAQAYLKSGSPELAIEEFNNVIRLAPDSEMARQSQEKIKDLR